MCQAVRRLHLWRYDGLANRQIRCGGCVMISPGRHRRAGSDRRWRIRQRSARLLAGPGGSRWPASTCIRAGSPSSVGRPRCSAWLHRRRNRVNRKFGSGQPLWRGSRQNRNSLAGLGLPDAYVTSSRRRLFGRHDRHWPPVIRQHRCQPGIKGTLRAQHPGRRPACWRAAECVGKSRRPEPGPAHEAARKTNGHNLPSPGTCPANSPARR